MASEADTTEATDPGETHHDPEAERLGRLEEKVDRLAAMVAKVIPGSHAEAEAREEKHLDRASSIEEQVQAELDKRDRQAADAAAAEKDKADRETTAQRLARLEEKPPAPPRQRRTILLGWGDGRK